MRKRLAEVRDDVSTSDRPLVVTRGCVPIAIHPAHCFPSRSAATITADRRFAPSETMARSCTSYFQIVLIALAVAAFAGWLAIPKPSSSVRRRL
jgi:hypothetical protein